QVAAQDPELMELFGDAMLDPQQMQEKMEERIRSKQAELLAEKRGSGATMQVAIKEIDPFDMYIWFELHKTPSEDDMNTLGSVIRAWYVVGKLGGYNSANLQVPFYTTLGNFEQEPGRTQVIRAWYAVGKLGGYDSANLQLPLYTTLGNLEQEPGRIRGHQSMVRGGQAGRLQLRQPAGTPLRSRWVGWALLFPPCGLPSGMWWALGKLGGRRLGAGHPLLWYKVGKLGGRRLGAGHPLLWHHSPLPIRFPVIGGRQIIEVQVRCGQGTAASALPAAAAAAAAGRLMEGDESSKYKYDVGTAASALPATLVRPHPSIFPAMPPPHPTPAHGGRRVLMQGDESSKYKYDVGTAASALLSLLLLSNAGRRVLMQGDESSKYKYDVGTAASALLSLLLLCTHMPLFPAIPPL
ncbi:unnamed protein product, partial [Closterium sp. Naga37s-1]